MVLKVEWHNKKKAFRKVDLLTNQILDSRRKIYQDNWGLMSLDALLSGAYYKVNRAMFTFEPNKRLDDVLDAINFLRFVAIRLLENERLI